jgi:zinc and cadmium transporter
MNPYNLNTLPLLMILSFIGSVLGLVGGVVLLIKGKISQESSLHLISFAAGVIISAAFLDLLPEAVAEGGEGVFLLCLIGMVGFFLLEDFVLHFHHHEEHTHTLKPIVFFLIISDSIHNFIDGVAIAAALVTDVKLGLVVALATFAHEIPQEIGDFAVLLSTGLSKTKVLLANLFSALATFAGALLTYYFLGSVRTFIGPALGLATGMFIYIASADILPELVRAKKRDSKWHTAGFFLLGISLIFVLTRFLPD